ncbi:BTH_I0359 family protein [Derxia gummosa]|uniref:BTH_I0359 family protein n=1 Tax=Derxia gummosa DSM 723 TaxID=1121388 RepID=A0A8B6X0G1_9BURK|nr:DUF3567 domain-containing protein [Derxia gummosa]
MNLIYNSDLYCVVEFAFGAADQPPAKGEPEVRTLGGYEIMDKVGRREIYIAGLMAEKFRSEVNELIATHPSMDDIDEFLGRFKPIMAQPVALH